MSNFLFKAAQQHLNELYAEIEAESERLLSPRTYPSDAFDFAWAAFGTHSGRMRVHHPNMEQRERPKRATPLLEGDGTVYDVSSLPILSTEQAQEVGRRALAEGIAPTVFHGSAAKDHIVCCNPAVALCGADQRGEMFGIGAPDNKRMCSACAALSSDPNHKCCADCPGDAK